MILAALTSNPIALGLDPATPRISDGTFLAWVAPEGEVEDREVSIFYGKADAARSFPTLPWHQLDVPAPTVVFGDEPAVEVT